MPKRASEENSFEPKVSSFAKTLQGELFIDVGANIGQYVSLLQENFRKILAIEADPAICQCLKRLCPRNCEVVNAAAADILGYAELARNPDNLIDGASIMEEKGITVRKIPLSSIIREQNVDLVKVDVEGAEWLVLRGAEQVMDKIRAWIIELHDPARKTELASYMKQYGYECTWLDEGTQYTDGYSYPHAYFFRSR